jgi:hypothetical protein
VRSGHEEIFMVRAFPGLVAYLGLLMVPAPTLAHHSFAAVFDLNKPLTLTGVITKVDWSNPHIYFYVDVKDNRGKVVNWAFQIAGPQSLLRRGWTKDTLRLRDRVTVTGYRARGDAHVAAAREVVFPDGRRLLTGCAYDGGPQR